MATLAKMVTKTLDIGVKDTKIDLSAIIKSYDLTDTKFIFNIISNQGLSIDLTGSTAMYIVEYVHNSQNYAIQGEVDIIDSTTIAFSLPEDLKGYRGNAIIGLYVQMADGTKIDLKDIVVKIEPSIMDKGIDFTAKTYFEDFETVEAEVILAGENAKNQINAVLPTIQSQVSELDRQIKALPQIPDLFVAYADNINGGGFSKTDSSKLYKGYGVKNSNLPADYRWERNVDSLQIGGRNLYVQSANNTFAGDGSQHSDTSKVLKKYGFKSVYNANKEGLSNVRLQQLQFNGITYGTVSFDAYVNTGSLDLRVDICDSENKNFTISTTNSRYSVFVDNIYRYNTATDNYNGFVDFMFTLSDGQTLYVEYIMVEHATTPSNHAPAPEDLTSKSSPINSILATLSAENPSTTLGGTWTQLGNESKFNQTIYYWKRTN